MKTMRLLAVLALLLGVFAVAGCSDDDASPVTPDPEIVPPVSAQELMFRFMAAHEARDIAGFAVLLDPTFELRLRQSTVAAFSLPRDWFSHAEQLLIAERMFSGQPYTPPGGAPVPAVTRIQFNIIRQAAAWAATTAEDPFADAIWAPFQVDLDVELGQDRAVAIRGIVEFYLTTVELPAADGTPTPYYRLVGLVDYTGAAAKRGIEDSAWGDLQAMFH